LKYWKSKRTKISKKIIEKLSITIFLIGYVADQLNDSIKTLCTENEEWSEKIFIFG
jgi:hypothetical protein